MSIDDYVRAGRQMNSTRICVNNHGAEDQLTVGQSYEILSEYRTFLLQRVVEVISDQGQRIVTGASRFQ